ncbi:MAG: hypothetical protein QM765_42470 [Myxococcales bacterium]
MTRASGILKRNVAALALVVCACNLSMSGKDQCSGAGDCLVGYRCLRSRCVLESECPVVCGNTCCSASEHCDPLVTACRPDCVPQCKGRQCGNDGCNGNCGDCGKGWSCDEQTARCEICQSDCAGKQCGSDGCGRTCGTCNSWEMCNSSFTCVNAPRDAGVIFMPDAGSMPADAGAMASEDAGEPDAGEPTDGAVEDAGADQGDSGATEPADAELSDAAGPAEADGGEAPDAGTDFDAGDPVDADVPGDLDAGAEAPDVAGG